MPKTAMTASLMNFSTMPPVRFEHAAGQLEEARHRVPERFRVEALAERRRVDDVGEEHGDPLPRLGRRLSERGAAAAAETVSVRVLGAAPRARDHARQPTTPSVRARAARPPAGP